MTHGSATTAGAVGISLDSLLKTANLTMPRLFRKPARALLSVGIILFGFTASGVSAAGDIKTAADLELFEAIVADDARRVEAAVHQGAHVNEARNSQGESPLMAACGLGNLALVKLLKELGADLNLPVSTGLTYTNALARSLGKTSVLMYLVENGADIRGSSRTEPLILEVARTANVVVARYLLIKGADVNESNTSGWTALMSAVTSGQNARGRIEMVRLLVEWGALVDRRDADGQTALMQATDSHIVAYLLEKNADVNAVDARGNTVLSRVLASSALKEQEIAGLAQILLGKGASPDMLNGDKRTPLMIVVWRGYRAVAGILLDKGAGVDARDPIGVTALSVAAESHQAEMMRLLINRGADVNARDLFGGTPLFHLFNGLPCETMSDDAQLLVNILLDAGADLNMADSNNETLIDILRERGCASELTDYLRSKAVKQAVQAQVAAPRIGTPKTTAPPPQQVPERTGEKAREARISRKVDQLSYLYRRFYLAMGRRDLAVMDETFALGIDLNVQNKYLPDGTFLLTAIKSRDMILTAYLLTKKADANLRDLGGLTPLGAAVGSRHIMKFLFGKGADLNALCPSVDLMETPLALAVRQNDIESVKLLLSLGADVNRRDSTGSPPIMPALFLPDLAIARLMVDAGADVNTEVPGDWTTPLMNAVVSNNGPVVEFLVAAGADVNGKNIRGYSPLLLAVELADRSIIGLLLDKGADINLSGYGGTTPLIEAVMLNRGLSIVELLLARGAEVNASDNNGITPLIIATIRGQKDVVALLLDRGADVSLPDRLGKTPSDYAGERPNAELEAILRAAAVKVKVDAILAKTGKKQLRPEQLLAKAVRDGDIKGVRVLLDKGVRVTSRDDETRRPLITLAVVSGNLDMVDLLLDRGADINDAAGTTNLHVAVEAGQKAMVEHLLTKGARVNTLAEDGGSPLHAAVRLACVAEMGAAVDAAKKQQADRYRELAALLLDAGADTNAGTLQTTDLGEDSLWNPLHLAAYLGSPAMTGLLLRWAQVDARSANGNTPLHLAVLTLSGAAVVDVVALLLERGANPNDKNIKGNGVLQEALVWWDSWPGWGAVTQDGITRPRWLIMVEKLLAGGANPNEPGEYGVYPLHAAAESGLTELAELLIEKGGQPNVTDRDGNTPLYLAVRQNRTEMVRLLLGKNADRNPVNREEKTPLDEARRLKRNGSAEAVDIERLLLAAGAEAGPEQDKSSASTP